MVPISGSAYTYAYASLGELVAWIIGWDLIVEYAVGNIGVAIGWSGYFRELLTHFGVGAARLARDRLPIGAHGGGGGRRPERPTPTTQYLASALSTAPHVLRLPVHRQPARLPRSSRSSPSILVIGIRESANSNNAMVLLKIGIILFFVRGGRHADQAGATGTIRPLGGFAPNGFAGISAGRGDHLLQLHRIRRDLARRRRRPRIRRGTCRSGSS